MKRCGMAIQITQFYQHVSKHQQCIPLKFIFQEMNISEHYRLIHTLLLIKNLSKITDII